MMLKKNVIYVRIEQLVLKKHTYKIIMYLILLYRLLGSGTASDFVQQLEFTR